MFGQIKINIQNVLVRYERRTDNHRELIIIFLHTDVTPPELTCPKSFVVKMSDDDNFAIVQIFPDPDVTGKNK